MRQTVRDALGVLLTANLIGPNQAQTVTTSKLENMVGLAPVVLVESAGTDRTAITFEDDMPLFDLRVIIYVQQATTGWTNAQAMDAVDTIESLLADVIEANRCTCDWDYIRYNGPSEVDEITEGTGGARYYREIVPIRIWVH